MSWGKYYRERGVSSGGMQVTVPKFAECLLVLLIHGWGVAGAGAVKLIKRTHLILRSALSRSAALW